MMDKEVKLGEKIFGLFFGLLMIFGSMNILIFSAPVVQAEDGSPEIHLNEIGFSADFVDTLSTTLYCPRFKQNSDWETQIIVSNPSEDDANLEIYYYTDEGDLIDEIYEQIETHCTIDFISTDHGILEETGNAVISSDVPIFGNVIYYSEYCAAAEPLQTSPSPILYCPGFYQTEEWYTWIYINNIGIDPSDVTLTYYDEFGEELCTVFKLLFPHETQYFRPYDDGIEATLGSIIIESSTEEGLIGFVFKMCYGSTIAYTYSLINNLDNTHSATFITGEDNSDELIFFNPEPEMKVLDLTFFDEEGNQINSLINEQFEPYSTYKILVNDYDEGYSFGSVKIESDNNGIVGYFGHIGQNYGLANSIEMKRRFTLHLNHM